VIAYHNYHHGQDPAQAYVLPWNVLPEWSLYDDLADARLNHLVGARPTTDPHITQELDRFGLGIERTLQAFEDFTGIDFQRQYVSERALRAQFIDGLEHYLDHVVVQELDQCPTYYASLTKYPDHILRDRNPLLRDIPGPYAWLDSDVPPGVMLLHQYLSPEYCERLRTFADTQPDLWGGVIDLQQGGYSKKRTEQRIAGHIALDPIIDEIVTLFNDIFCKRLAACYQVVFEWYERPALIRYPVGGKYDAHSDSESWVAERAQWQRFLDRDYSVVLWLNDDFKGGDFTFIDQGYSIRPRVGSIVAFPSDHRYLHAVQPTTDGIRYALVSWGATVGSLRVNKQPPYGAIFLRQGHDYFVQDEARRGQKNENTLQ